MRPYPPHPRCLHLPRLPLLAWLLLTTSAWSADGPPTAPSSQPQPNPVRRAGALAGAPLPRCCEAVPGGFLALREYVVLDRFDQLPGALAGVDIPAGEPPPGAAAASVPSAPPAPIPLSIPALTARALQALHQDGSSDPQELASMLADINQAVAARLVLDPDRSQEAELAGSDALAAPDRWRLWVFWAVDVPECAGLAEALVAVRASGCAQVRPVHLCSLRHWDAWFARMNGAREQLLAAARQQDQAGCDAISAAWRASVAPGDAMIRCFSRHGLGVLSDARMAVALRVDQIPSFRLVSPDRHVHALAGFTPALDLVGWIRTCQAWDAGQGDPARAPAR